MEYQSLSVIVPIYNTLPYLPRCIDSILKQTFSVSEIILIDDGSSDGSELLCDSYALLNKNIKVIHQKNQGLSAARNTGLDIASGRWITFVDSDDYIDLKMYEILFDNAIEQNAEISIGGIWIEKETGEKFPKYKTDINKVFSSEEALVALNNYSYFDMSVCDRVFLRSLFDNIRFPINKLCEDYFITHKIIAKANRVVFLSEPFYHYVQRNNSISRGKKINMSGLEASQSQLDFFRNEFPHLLPVAETAYAFSNMAIFNSYIRNGVICPEGLKCQLRTSAKTYLKSVLKNPYIPVIKKCQALAFCNCLPLYQFIVSKTSHR